MNIKFNNVPQDAYSTFNDVPPRRDWLLSDLISDYFSKIKHRLLREHLDPLMRSLILLTLNSREFESCLWIEVEKDDSEGDFIDYLRDRLKTKVDLIDFNDDNGMEWGFKYKDKTYSMITDKFVTKIFILSDGNVGLNEIAKKL